VLAFALSVVFGLAQALPVLHFVLVAHRLCAEHGEMLHADASEPPAPHASADRSGSADEQRLVASAGAEHTHEHCGVIVSSHPHGVRLLSPGGSCTSVSYRTSAAGEAKRAHPSIALLAYAPKLAPPALA
jgi:hypothetical protein